MKGTDVFIIAEIGKNFIQSKDERPVAEYLANAKELIRLAKEAGADAVKFQTHNVGDEQMNIEVVSPHFSGSDRYSWVKRNMEATPFSFWQEIKKYADSLGIRFFSTPMSRGAAKILSEIGVSMWKVGSGDILDFVLLDYLAKTGKPIFISTGMSTLAEVDLMMDFLKKRNATVTLLHCVSKYPCPPEELNLKSIEFLRKRYSVPVGFSDHSIGHDSAVAAASLGAVVIEKHFSTSRENWGSDHKVSMTPDEFKTMVSEIRAEKKIDVSGYGSEEKIVQEGEEKFRPFFRKTLVYAKDLQKGTKLSAEDMYAMRPQAFVKGFPSERYEEVLGGVLSRNVVQYEPIQQSDLA